MPFTVWRQFILLLLGNKKLFFLKSICLQSGKKAAAVYVVWIGLLWSCKLFAWTFLTNSVNYSGCQVYWKVVLFKNTNFTSQIFIQKKTLWSPKVQGLFATCWFSLTHASNRLKMKWGKERCIASDRSAKHLSCLMAINNWITWREGMVP